MELFVLPSCSSFEYLTLSLPASVSLSNPSRTREPGAEILEHIRCIQYLLKRSVLGQIQRLCDQNHHPATEKLEHIQAAGSLKSVFKNLPSPTKTLSHPFSLSLFHPQGGRVFYYWYSSFYYWYSSLLAQMTVAAILWILGDAGRAGPAIFPSLSRSACAWEPSPSCSCAGEFE